MKRSLLLASIVAIYGITSAPTALAAGFQEVNFTCPAAVGSGPNVLFRTGGTIAGFGQETVNGNPVYSPPYFNYYISVPNIPTKLTSYYNDGTDYDSVNGVVSCIYSSSGGYDPFVTNYQMTNGYGGQIAWSTADSISINQLVGLAK